MPEKTFKWDSPHEWLDDRIQKLVLEKDIQKLSQDFKQLASQCSGDDIQDLFQSDMVEDGYFQPENPEQKWRAHYAMVADGEVWADGHVTVEARSRREAKAAACEAAHDDCEYDITRLDGICEILSIEKVDPDDEDKEDEDDGQD